MKKFLEKLIAAKEAKVTELRAAAEKSESLTEVRSIGATLEALGQEIADAKAQLDELEKEGDNENRSANGFNPVAAYGVNNANATGTASMEYRSAFKSFVQNGTPIPADVEQRAATPITSGDIGKVIPQTIMDKIIKDLKVYGQLYNKVRHLNVKGGVMFPISTLKATFNWVQSETSGTHTKKGDVKGAVSFNYYLGEVKINQSIVADTVSLDMFEDEIAELIVQGFLEAMDKAIVSGTGVGQPLGLTADPRLARNVVEMTAVEFASWEAWRKKIFGKLPLAKRGEGEFILPTSTVETYVTSMRDLNDRPLFNEALDAKDGKTTLKFFGREITLVEPDVIKDFDLAETGDVVGIYWVPKDYAINSNLQFGIKKYTDENTNEKVTKGLVICDGKILDTAGCIIIKKAGEAA